MRQTDIVSLVKYFWILVAYETFTTKNEVHKTINQIINQFNSHCNSNEVDDYCNSQEISSETKLMHTLLKLILCANG